MFTCLNQRCDNSTLVNNFDYNVSHTLKKVYNTKMRNIADTEISLVHHVFDSWKNYLIIYVRYNLISHPSE